MGILIDNYANLLYTILVRFRTNGGIMDIEKYIQQIEQFNKEQDAVYHNVAMKYGLSDTSLWIIYNVYINKNCINQRDLVCQCSFPKQTINTSITKLVNKGYIKLENISNWGKKKNIILTAEGKEFANATIGPLIKAEKKAYSVLNDEELNLYLEMASKITNSLREEVEKIKGVKL